MLVVERKCTRVSTKYLDLVSGTVTPNINCGSKTKIAFSPGEGQG